MSAMETDAAAASGSAPPALSDEDEMMFNKLLADPATAEIVRDLRFDFNNGDKTKAEFLVEAGKRMRSIAAMCAEPPPEMPDHLRVSSGDRLAVLLKRPAEDGAIAGARTVAALDAVINGPQSRAEDRALWPIKPPGAMDPTCTATIVDNALCLKFDTEADAELWVWRMNYEVFANEGAGLLYTQNMAFNMFRVPKSLSSLLYHVVNGVVDAERGGRWALAAGEEDKVGRYEYGKGEEKLSEWLERTVGRLSGEVPTYATADPSEW